MMVVFSLPVDMEDQPKVLLVLASYVPECLDDEVSLNPYPEPAHNVVSHAPLKVWEVMAFEQHSTNPRRPFLHCLQQIIAI